MHVGRLIRILSHSMRRHNPAEMIENKDLTSMQKHVLKFILLETIHRDLYQKDIEEEFQIRKPTVTGIPQLMEKNGYIYRECAKQDARLKRILPTEKAESLRQPILHSIEEDEAAMIRGIPKEDVELCKQVLWQMCANRTCLHTSATEPVCKQVLWQMCANRFCLHTSATEPVCTAPHPLSGCPGSLLLRPLQCCEG